VFPTLVDYLHLPYDAGRGQPGRSFRAALDGEAFIAKDPVVVFDEYGPVRMVRTSEWKYVHRYPDGPHELFDLVNDPGERTNLVGQSSAQPVAERLRASVQAAQAGPLSITISVGFACLANGEFATPDKLFEAADAALYGAKAAGRNRVEEFRGRRESDLHAAAAAHASS
jgi:hypothetical protein